MMIRGDFPAGRTPIQSSEAAEKILPFVAQWLDSDHIVFPTDFPHSFTFEPVIEEVKGFVGGKIYPRSSAGKFCGTIRNGCTAFTGRRSAIIWLGADRAGVTDAIATI
ncbi:MAG TPA: hypothetical protein VK355_04320 [Candidatus Binatia bacterium]|nr:hypothetical protein [Candidatus Binatia bacterium]